MALVDISDLTVKYVGRKTPTLNGISLQLNAGETVLLLGASGSGKSTLALTLNGLIPHAVGSTVGGRIVVDGLDTQETSVAELAQRVGIVFQDPDAQFATLKVEDEIVFGLENLCRPLEVMNEVVDDVLEQVGMRPMRQRPVYALSGGEKQRIALAALLAMEPQLLVFDEPTANLDPVGTQDVFALLAELKSRHRHTILLIEHKLDDLMPLIDRVIVLDAQGQLLADGTPQQVFAEQAEALQAEGVWIPQVCLLAQRLEQLGVVLEPFPVTLTEAEVALSKFVWDDENSYADRVDGHSTNARGSHRFSSTITDSLQANSPLAIEVRELSFNRGAGRMLDKVSLKVPQGDFLAIVGANGAGKTTLAHQMMGILQPPRESVFINGRDVSQIPVHEVARVMGYVFQNPEHQFIADTVFDEVAYGLRVMEKPRAEIEARTQELLETFGLARYGKANPFTLSHGEKRRLSVATMLAMGQQTEGKQILILDEPTFGQDQRNANALLHLLHELHQQGCTIIVITHDMALVAEHAQHAAVLAGGRLIFHGTPEALFAEPELLTLARLTMPPLARLAARLSTHHPQWEGCVTVDEFVQVVSAALPTSSTPTPIVI